MEKGIVEQVDALYAASDEVIHAILARILDKVIEPTEQAA